MSATYRRSANGSKIHKASCRMLSIGQGVEWRYAEGMSAEQVADTIDAAPWLSACKFCKPSTTAATP